MDSKPPKAKPTELATSSKPGVFKPRSLTDRIDLGMSSEALIARRRCAKSPNDPKLSDRGVRRGTCMVGGKVAAEAGAVTHGAVRCSAWLGDSLATVEDNEREKEVGDEATE